MAHTRLTAEKMAEVGSKCVGRVADEIPREHLAVYRYVGSPPDPARLNDNWKHARNLLPQAHGALIIDAHGDLEGPLRGRNWQSPAQTTDRTKRLRCRAIIHGVCFAWRWIHDVVPDLVGGPRLIVAPKHSAETWGEPHIKCGEPAVAEIVTTLATNAVTLRLPVVNAIRTAPCANQRRGSELSPGRVGVRVFEPTQSVDKPKAPKEHVPTWAFHPHDGVDATTTTGATS